MLLQPPKFRSVVAWHCMVRAISSTRLAVVNLSHPPTSSFLSLSCNVPFLSSSHSLYIPYSRIVEELLLLQGDVITVDNDGNSPLHLACMSGSLKVVELLIRLSAADINTRWVH